MENTNNGYSFDEGNTLKDYINLIRNNILPVIIISAACLVVSVVFALNSVDIFRATTTLKISKPQGNILESPLTTEFQDFGSDRFIANEIEIMKSYSVRENVAKALYDSVENNDKRFAAIINKDFQFSLTTEKILTIPEVATMLTDYVDVEQKRGLDIVEISVESPSPQGAAILANSYANEYRNINLEQNRNQLTLVKNFLKEQRDEKFQELKNAEEIKSTFEVKGGIVALDEQANSLITTLASFEAQMNAARIELSASDRVLGKLKSDLEMQNPRMADYLESVSSEVYFKGLQEQIAKYEVNRDVAMANSKGDPNSPVVKEYDQKLRDLRKKLNDRLEVIKSGIFASSPEEVKQLTEKILSEETKNQSLRTSVGELTGVVNQYDSRFNKLPKTIKEWAGFKRNTESLEKLYLLVEEKYQEALINEQSQPGNVLIVDKARVPKDPAKPNRLLIILIGLVIGGGLAFGFVFVKNYFDNTIKTPEDIQNKNVNVLAWIPQIEGGAGLNGNKEFEFIVARKPDSIPAEAFRALRTRVQFSKADNKTLKTILVTSSAPQEGKTTISVNLAGSFAQSNKKTLIVDCDLRKPRMHTVFNAGRYPGLIDYLFGQVKFEDILRESEINNLSYITAGTIPPNPAEMLDSEQMRNFIEQMREKYEMVILDSPPIIAVTDSEIISRYVDATILVCSSEKTEIEMLEKSVKLIKNDSSSFIGTVLNNFSYKAGYGAYYKYYYYYSQPANGKPKGKDLDKVKNS